MSGTDTGEMPVPAGIPVQHAPDAKPDEKTPGELPEGIKKEILKEGEGSANPKKGDEVSVHYVGTLESDGTEFDSSRSRGDPFVFTLGKGQVIKGWDLGVATMKRGELAKFTLSPEYAYGDRGSPPKIPAKSTLVFEVELFNWLAKDDLFKDGGVIKSQVKEGTGWKKPKNGEELLISLKVTAKDGTVVEEKSSFEYVVGAEALGPLSKTVDKALGVMKKDEHLQLTCTKEYACGDKTPEGATVDLILHQIYETKDVSLAKDKSLMKKMVYEGIGYASPNDGSKVKLKVTETFPGSYAGFQPSEFDFITGTGEVCDAVECAVSEMRMGEKALITCTDPQMCCDERLGLKDISAAKVCLTLEVIEFEKGQDTWDMSEEEKIEFGTLRKEAGSKLFRAGRIMLALGRYKKVIEVFQYTDNYKDEKHKAVALDLKKACELNSASCQLKLKDFEAAKAHCETVLKDDSTNIKAMFRRAQANIGLKNFTDSMAELKKLLEVDPKNKEARCLYKEAQAGQKALDQQSKGLFSTMCKALGKGPIPEPLKNKKIVPEDDDIKEALTEQAAVAPVSSGQDGS